jgi:hypothetical protein
MNAESVLRDRALATLLAAADAAEQQPRVNNAVSIAWSTLHRDHDLYDSGPRGAFQTDYHKLLGIVFGAWKHIEGFHSETTYLGETLRRRHETPADVAASLRRAADLVQTWHPAQDIGRAAG